MRCLQEVHSRGASRNIWREERKAKIGREIRDISRALISLKVWA